MRSRQLYFVGLSHHCAPIALREKVAIGSDELPEALSALRSRPGVEEAILLSTCNRLEIYAAVSGEEGATSVRSFLCEREPSAAEHLNEAVDLAAIRHLFRVCSSLDSMVIGEAQILGQVKEALHAAEAAGTVGGLLTRVMQRAFSVAKRVRSETQIGAAAVSMGSAGVEVAKKVLGNLEDKRALLVGAGEIGGLAGRSLVAAGCREVRVVNRSRDRAESLAAELGAEVHPWDALDELLVRSDLVVCSTAAQGHVIRLEKLKEVRRRRRHRPLLFIDLALPRDVDPRVNDLPEVYLFDVDDLDRVLEENRSAREREAAVAEGWVEREASAFFAALRNEAEPLLKEIHKRAEEIVLAEVEKTLARQGISPEQRAHLEALGRAIAKKILHLPTARIRQAGLADDGSLLAAAVTLFGLSSERAEAAPLPRRAEVREAPQATAANEAKESEERPSPALVGRRFALTGSGNS